MSNPTTKQARLIQDINNSADQRNSFAKLARFAEELPGMGYEVERLWDAYREMDRDVDYRIELAMAAGATLAQIDAQS